MSASGKLDGVCLFCLQSKSGVCCCGEQVKPEEIELVRRDYTANGGWETFLAYEDPRQDILVGLLRLRKVSGAAKSRQAELQGRCSIVRELHVYGVAVAVSARDATKQQHQVSTSASSATAAATASARVIASSSAWRASSCALKMLRLLPLCRLSVGTPANAQASCTLAYLLFTA